MSASRKSRTYYPPLVSFGGGFRKVCLAFKRLGFHSLRHTFVSELANADVPADVRRQISGHSDGEIHERYTHLALETKRRALAHLRPLRGSDD